MHDEVFLMDDEVESPETDLTDTEDMDDLEEGLVEDEKDPLAEDLA